MYAKKLKLEPLICPKIWQLKKVIMKILAENDEILAFLVNKHSLISSTVNSLLIKGAGDGIIIEVTFSLMYSSQIDKLVLVFENVTAYAFNYDSDNAFYNVESYKLLAVQQGYYLSLDPYDECEKVDERDNDFVIASRVKVYNLTVV